MALSPLALGFIGGSVESAVGYVHCIACRMDNRWDLQAGCFSLSEAENRETGVGWGVDEKRIYGTWREMVEAEKGGLDAIAVLTPIPSHVEMVLECLDAGHAVICEKALACSSFQRRSACSVTGSPR